MAGNETLKSITIPTRSSAGTFDESLYHTCSAWPAVAPPLDLSSDDLIEIQNCSGCGSGLFPQGVVQRSFSTGTVTTPIIPGNKSGTDGNPLTSVLCMRINGTVANNTYRDLNLTLLVLFLSAEGKMKVIRHDGNFPRPQAPNPNSIKIIGNSQ